MRKICKGDTVVVIAGRDKGKQGDVLQVVQDGKKVLVSGVNTVKKHTKPNPGKNEVGGIVSKTMPLDISNVAIYNPETKKADRVGIKTSDGKKFRVYKSNGKAVEFGVK
jgi:large subunit ribosomal protein L24